MANTAIFTITPPQQKQYVDALGGFPRDNDQKRAKLPQKDKTLPYFVSQRNSAVFYRQNQIPKKNPGHHAFKSIVCASSTYHSPFSEPHKTCCLLPCPTFGISAAM